MAELVQPNDASDTAQQAAVSTLPSKLEGETSPGVESLVPEGNLDERELQHGVLSAKAMVQVLTRPQLILAYCMIWLIYFVLAFSSGIFTTLTPYVTSDFQRHSLTATTTIVSSLIGGLFKLLYAKLIDVWGRQQGFALMVAVMTMGAIMMAACQNVQTYCAAQVFYNVGYNGVNFTLTIFIADTSSLRNRAFVIAYTGSCSLITAWIYGPAANSILRTIGFRWGFGLWAVVLPVTCFPLFVLLQCNQMQAEKAGLVPKRRGTLSWRQLVIYYCKEFDVFGLLLIATGLSLFLLSFSLYSYQEHGWNSLMIICFIIIGFFLIIAFSLYEKFLAPVTFIPWDLLRNRTVLSTFIMAGSFYTTVRLYSSYFYSFVIVVFRQTITQTTYIQNIYTVGAGVWAMVLGVAFRYYGRVKWYALFFGIPLSMLGVGLLIHFRFDDTKASYLVMCMIFIAFGGGTLYLTEQITLMAVSAQEHIPAVLALEAMAIEIGEAVGGTIAAAIWTGVFPKKLMEYLPPRALPDFLKIYGSLQIQASYPVGSPERIAIDHAYSDTQRLMLITSVCILPISLISVLFWKNVDIKTMRKKDQGLLF
ncbi:hypothetical protein NCS52_00751300 [Fusarium sp. LHS14.1]|nr:hypothetical protein NCS52_00751300 [Fusarium sp. LHS14.1]